VGLSSLSSQALVSIGTDKSIKMWDINEWRVTLQVSFDEDLSAVAACIHSSISQGDEAFIIVGLTNGGVYLDCFSPHHFFIRLQ